MKIPIIGIPLEYTLKITGLWPDMFNIIGPIVIASAMVTTLPFQWWDTYKLLDNPLMLMNNLSDLMSELLLYIKILIIWSNKSYLVDLLREMAEDYDKKTVTKKWLTLNHNARRFCKYDYTIYMGASLMYYVQFFLMYIEMPVESREMMLRAYYPFDYKSSPIFEIFFVVQVIYGISWCMIQSMSESLLVALVLHVCGHIDLLIDQIKLFSESCNAVENSHSLILVIRRHLKVLNLVNKIENVYAYVSLAQVFLSTLIICSTGFVVLTMTETDQIVIVIKYLVLYFTLTWQIFSFCYAGQHLINKSSMIPVYVYDTAWYNTEPKKMKAVSFILRRAQAPVSLSAGKFVALSTQTFTLVLRTSFSYLSVLRTRYA